MKNSMFPGTYRTPTFFPETAECRRCGVAKALAQFQKTHCGGRRRVCRGCMNAAKRARRAAGFIVK